ncbi:MAG: bifunctional hydroxymethylpyrimidine kinase/phosphomethylpyrimidine kinase [Planctomycetota bacterium]|nr:bifunctional hydroxymethylpyrimidine kinase/phosphomethylpyrimidine kinase [Planctomycetota bacterium]
MSTTHSSETPASETPASEALVALTIAGSDPSGGAGIQADLKTFHQHRVYGAAVISLITVQNTLGLQMVQPLEADAVVAQIDAVISDLPPAAGKVGALGTAAIVEAVAARALEFKFPLVVDPIFDATDGRVLLEPEARQILKDRLLPVATLATPNIEEAAFLSGRSTSSVGAMKDAAKAIADIGVASVLVTGGGGPGEAVDVLYTAEEFHTFRSKRVSGGPFHGTGCTLSAAITAHLARGIYLVDAVRCAKDFLSAAIDSMPGLGSGSSPLNHHAVAGIEPTAVEEVRSTGTEGR